MFTMSYLSGINDDTKIMMIFLIGIAAGMVILTAFYMPHDQVCREIPNYAEQAYDDPHMYNPDPEMQLHEFRQEFGDSWASGHYDDENDTLYVCKYKDVEP